MNDLLQVDLLTIFNDLPQNTQALFPTFENDLSLIKETDFNKFPNRIKKVFSEIQKSYNYEKPIFKVLSSVSKNEDLEMYKLLTSSKIVKDGTTQVREGVKLLEQNFELVTTHKYLDVVKHLVNDDTFTTNVNVDIFEYNNHIYACCIDKKLAIKTDLATLKASKFVNLEA